MGDSLAPNVRSRARISVEDSTDRIPNPATRCGYNQPASSEGAPIETGLAGKVAMVSGASKGIGRAVAEKLAAEGTRLSLCARSADQLGAVARDLEAKYHVACLPYPADLNRLEDIQ